MTNMVPFPTFAEEHLYLQNGFSSVIGADEVGWGAFAGPVVAAAVILPYSFPGMEEIHDSKLLSHAKRVTLVAIIKTHARAYAIAEVPVQFINDHGIKQATDKAFQDAVAEVYAKLSTDKVFLLTDGFLIPDIADIPPAHQRGIVKGDRISRSIAAASVIAKVYRDNLMVGLHSSYPVYQFHLHKGYGTAIHQKAMKEHGLCPEHRMSFNFSSFL